MKTLQGTDLLALQRGTGTYKVVYSDLNQVVSVGTTPPTTPVKGALWHNTDKGVTYVFNGSVWVGRAN